MFTEGFSILTPYNTTIQMRLAISCITCDIPATRNICGFLSHNANLGCNKCYYNFADNKEVSSIFDRSKWKEKLQLNIVQIVGRSTKKLPKLKYVLQNQNYGVRPCTLLKLSYYDPITFVAIDIMHNIMLGTANHMFCTWVGLGLLTESNLSKLDILISKFIVPRNVGRLPTHIKSNYLSFKASQWSSWTIIYSPILLKDILPHAHYKCWLLFVRATTILCQRMLTYADVDTADKLLENFCKSVETIYECNRCTPNMHLHLHIKRTLLDFGSAHATWCFSFE